MRSSVGLAVAVLTIIMGSGLHAQQAPSNADVRIAPGIVRQGGIFGDDDPESTAGYGFVIGAQMRGQMHRRTGFSFEATLQPVGIRNPHFDETLHTIYFLIGPEIGRRTYVRPVGGMALQAWSGSLAESGLNLALAFGLAVGHRKPAQGRDVGVEGIARASCSPGACSFMLGVQVPVSMTKR
jgi:hypothetical protein